MKPSVAFFVAAFALAGCTEAPRACTKMKTLCGTELDSCKGMRDSVRDSLGPDAVDKLDACFLTANSCSEATGCTTAAALKGVGAAASEFFDGLANELKKPSN